MLMTFSNEQGKVQYLPEFMVAFYKGESNISDDIEIFSDEDAVYNVRAFIEDRLKEKLPDTINLETDMIDSSIDTCRFFDDFSVIAQDSDSADKRYVIGELNQPVDIVETVLGETFQCHE